jgi:hypothetical protein
MNVDSSVMSERNKMERGGAENVHRGASVVVENAPPTSPVMASRRM